MPEVRIIDGDGHVQELDEELSEFIGPPRSSVSAVWSAASAGCPG